MECWSDHHSEYRSFDQLNNLLSRHFLAAVVVCNCKIAQSANYKTRDEDYILARHLLWPVDDQWVYRYESDVGC